MAGGGEDMSRGLGWLGGALGDAGCPPLGPPLPALRALFSLSSHFPGAAPPGPPQAALSVPPLPLASLRKGKAELPRAGGGLAAPVPCTQQCQGTWQDHARPCRLTAEQRACSLNAAPSGRRFPYLRTHACSPGSPVLWLLFMKQLLGSPGGCLCPLSTFAPVR